MPTTIAPITATDDYDLADYLASQGFVSCAATLLLDRMDKNEAARMLPTIPASPSVRTRQVKACLAAAGIDAQGATVRSHDAAGGWCVWVMQTDLDAAEVALADLWAGQTITRHDSFLSLTVLHDA